MGARSSRLGWRSARVFWSSFASSIRNNSHAGPCIPFEGVFIHRERVDMRKGINGLAEVVISAGMGQIQGANLFIFSGRAKHTIKVLYWDRSGFALWMKRLEEANLPSPRRL